MHSYLAQTQKLHLRVLVFLGIYPPLSHRLGCFPTLESYRRIWEKVERHFCASATRLDACLDLKVLSPLSFKSTDKLRVLLT